MYFKEPGKKGMTRVEENQLLYFDKMVLPVERLDELEQVKRVLRRTGVQNGIISGKSGGLLGAGEDEFTQAILEARKELQLDLLAESIVDKLNDERLGEDRGKIQDVIYSTGGSNSGRTRREARELKANEARTRYIAIKIRDFIILEAPGLYGNATFIGDDAIDLNDKMKKLGRRGAVKEKAACRVIHGSPIGKTGSYDYNHLIDLLESIIQNPDKVREQLHKNREGITLSKLLGAVDEMTSVGSETRNVIGSSLPQEHANYLAENSNATELCQSVTAMFDMEVPELAGTMEQELTQSR